MNPKVSIIIPCKDIDAQTSECIDTCLQLDHDNIEIIVLPDDKRNIGAKNSTGEFLAFIDSDEYPILQNKKNNELKRTETNSGSVSSYGVRTSSLLIFIPEHRVHREKKKLKSLQKAVGFVFSSSTVGGHAK